MKAARRAFLARSIERKLFLSKLLRVSCPIQIQQTQSDLTRVDGLLFHVLIQTEEQSIVRW